MSDDDADVVRPEEWCANLLNVKAALRHLRNLMGSSHVFGIARKSSPRLTGVAPAVLPDQHGARSTVAERISLIQGFDYRFGLGDESPGEKNLL